MNNEIYSKCVIECCWIYYMDVDWARAILLAGGLCTDFWQAIEGCMGSHHLGTRSPVP